MASSDERSPRPAGARRRRWTRAVELGFVLLATATLGLWCSIPEAVRSSGCFACKLIDDSQERTAR